MVALQPGAPVKPTPRPKAPRGTLRRGGAKPKEAGRRYEARIVEKYNDPPFVKVRRQVGSGAFGKVDPSLLADILIDLGRLRLAGEAKSWDKVDARGEKTINVPASVLYKLDHEAKTLNRDPVGILHMKNDTEEWVFIRMSWWMAHLEEWERMIQELTEQLSDALGGEFRASTIRQNEMYPGRE